MLPPERLRQQSSRHTDPVVPSKTSVSDFELIASDWVRLLSRLAGGLRLRFRYRPAGAYNSRTASTVMPAEPRSVSLRVTGAASGLPAAADGGAPRRLKRYLHVTGDRANPNSNHIPTGTCAKCQHSESVQSESAL